jgi:hypothetical protein
MQPAFLPTKTLPPDYRLLRKFDLSRELRLLLILNMAGLGLFILFGFLFYALARLIRPAIDLTLTVSSSSVSGLLLDILKLAATFAAALLLHELVHGLAFWIFTRETPRFGLRSAYAYAAAPSWYLPRAQYALIGVAPLAALSLLGLLVLPFLPVQAFPAWWFILTTNASGAVGDIYIVSWLLLNTRQALVNDHGDSMAIYVPAPIL